MKKSSDSTPKGRKESEGDGKGKKEKEKGKEHVAEDWTTDMRVALADRINLLEGNCLLHIVQILQHGVVKSEAGEDDVSDWDCERDLGGVDREEENAFI